MNSFDEFSRPEEYVSPGIKHFRMVLRNLIDKEVMPLRRRFDEDWDEHKLIEPLFDRIMGNKGLGTQKSMFPEEVGGWGLGTRTTWAALHMQWQKRWAGQIPALQLHTL